MNKLNDIFKMISQMEKNAEEVKLGKHEVELGLVDDLKNSINKVSTFQADVKSMNANAKQTNKLFTSATQQKEVILKNYNENRNKQEAILKELNTLFKTINTQAKELGIDINSLPVYKEYLSARENLSKSSSENQASWELVSKF
jgi:uncharacterized coiled-coil DUF342 family protein